MSGAKLREYHFCRALGERSRLTYAFFSQPDQPTPTRQDLPFCEEIVAVPAPSFYTPAKIARGLFGRWPLPIVNYTSPEMSAALARVLQAGSFDLVHLDSIHMAAYTGLLERHLKPLRVVYNWHNIESEAMRSHRRTMTSPLHRWYAGITAGRLEQTEHWALSQAFGHVVCSEREREILHAAAPKARIAVVDNGVDTAYFHQPLSAKPNRLVFVGTMGYHPNSEAAVSFSRRVWPSIFERFPHWRFTLVGANPPPQVQALAALPGVEVTGTVPDVRPYYRDAVAAVVPLRSGGGTRLKILEALAAGVPVLSTALGAEGLEVADGRHFVLVERDEDWLPALEKVAADGGAALVQSGRQLVQSRYDWNALGEKLVRSYQEWLRA